MEHTLTTTAVPDHRQRVTCACGWRIEGWSGATQPHVERHLRQARESATIAPPPAPAREPDAALRAVLREALLDFNKCEEETVDAWLDHWLAARAASTETTER